MSSGTAVLATGQVTHIRAPREEDERPVSFLQIRVSGFRSETPIEKPTLFTIRVVDDAALNCAECLAVGRSVGVLVRLVRPPKRGHAAGDAQAVFFVGRSSTASLDQGLTRRAKQAKLAKAA